MSTAEGDPARVRVGYLGPEGTFSEEALLASGDPDVVEPVAMATIFDAVTAAARGEVQWALVPIENSIEGSIAVTLDLLAGRDAGVRIGGEALLRVRHALIASGPMDMAQIDTVLTHPQVPGQCTRFLRGELPGAQILPSTSTAEAVRQVAQEPAPGRAAIGTRLAARIYGGVVLREGIEDRDDNETRFVWVTAREGAPPLLAPGEGGWKSSLVFWGPGADSPGWLLRCLSVFADRDINLTKIESRPRRGGLGSYMFFADLAAGAGEERVVDALAALGSLCEHVTVLGSYRSSAP